jgi:RimJ/RimL family protein N-acetyltransferase
MGNNYWQHPVWTQTIIGKRVRLVRPQAHHLPPLVSWFTDKAFVSHYNAFIGTPEQAAQGYIQRGQQPPQQLMQLDWIVEDLAGNAIGIASLADLQHFHKRAELLVGFPQKVSDRIVFETTLLVLNIAFLHLGLEKVISIIYGSNYYAQQIALNLGFRQEGKLALHLVSPVTQQREDLYFNGMLKDEFLNHPTIRKLAKRLLSG